MSGSSPPRIDENAKQTRNIPPILKFGGSDPYFMEQFKALRAKFEHLIQERKMKVVAVTSAIAGEGKTLSCVRLAANLAASERKKILLIDLDLRKSDIARGLGIPPLPGIGEFLRGTGHLKDVVRNTLIPGLYVIPGGKIIQDPSTLLAAEKIRSFLGKIREEFDVVLLDTPPILPVADTLSLRDLVDGFLFVFRASFTPHTMLRQALEELGDANILGVVINGVEPLTIKYYQRYYGKYYSSGKTS